MDRLEKSHQFIDHFLDALIRVARSFILDGIDAFVLRLFRDLDAPFEVEPRFVAIGVEFKERWWSAAYGGAAA